MIPRSLVVLAASLALAVPLARADEGAMQSALEELQAAKRHLQQSEKDYDGHRRAALEKVERAIAEVKQGLAVAERKDTRQEKKLEKQETGLEKKQQRIEKKLDQVEKKQQQLDD